MDGRRVVVVEVEGVVGSPASSSSSYSSSVSADLFGKGS